MYGLRHAIHNQFTGLVDAVTPTSSVSRFDSERVCPFSSMNMLAVRRLCHLFCGFQNVHIDKACT